MAGMDTNHFSAAPGNENAYFELPGGFSSVLSFLKIPMMTGVVTARMIPIMIYFK